MFNVTRSLVRDSIPWKVWIEDSVPLPTEGSGEHQGDVGAFEGGDYRDAGVYRPELNCLMRSYAPFCRVCRESLASHVLSYTSKTFFNKISLDTVVPIPSISKWDSVVVTGGRVVVRRIPGDTVPVALRWRFRGQWLAGVRETLDVASLVGDGPLEAILEGGSPFIRTPELVVRDTFYWSVRKPASVAARSRGIDNIRRVGPSLFLASKGAILPGWARDASGRGVPLHILSRTSEGWLVGGDPGIRGILFLDPDSQPLEQSAKGGAP